MFVGLRALSVMNFLPSGSSVPSLADLRRARASVQKRKDNQQQDQHTQASYQDEPRLISGVHDEDGELRLLSATSVALGLG